MNNPTTEGISFDKDLERVLQIKRAMAHANPNNPTPAYTNTANDCRFLLGFIDNLWREYSRVLNKQMDAKP